MKINSQVKIWKKALCLIFAFALSINSFAAIVSDNDGSAFITKAEFDSLKNNFQEQINQYNTSIDAKIDGAIAAYLAGIKLSEEDSLEVGIDNYKEINWIRNLNFKHKIRTFSAYNRYTDGAMMWQAPPTNDKRWLRLGRLSIGTSWREDIYWAAGFVRVTDLTVNDKFRTGFPDADPWIGPVFWECKGEGGEVFFGSDCDIRLRQESRANDQANVSPSYASVTSYRVNQTQGYWVNNSEQAHKFTTSPGHFIDGYVAVNRLYDGSLERLQWPLKAVLNDVAFGNQYFIDLINSPTQLVNASGNTGGLIALSSQEDENYLYDVVAKSQVFDGTATIQVSPYQRSGQAIWGQKFIDLTNAEIVNCQFNTASINIATINGYGHTRLSRNPEQENLSSYKSNYGLWLYPKTKVADIRCTDFIYNNKEMFINEGIPLSDINKSGSVNIKISVDVKKILPNDTSISDNYKYNLYILKNKTFHDSWTDRDLITLNLDSVDFKGQKTGSFTLDQARTYDITFDVEKNDKVRIMIVPSADNGYVAKIQNLDAKLIYEA